MIEKEKIKPQTTESSFIVSPSSDSGIYTGAINRAASYNICNTTDNCNGNDNDYSEYYLNSSKATTIYVGQSKSGYIGVNDGWLWYKFKANNASAHLNGYPGVYKIYTEGSLDTIGELYNSSLQLIAQNNDISNRNTDFYIEETLEYNQTYYIKVRTQKQTGHFSLIIDYESAPADTSNTECNPIILNFGNQVQTTLLGYNTDFWYKFTANAAPAHRSSNIGEYIITISAPTSCTYEIKTPTGTYHSGQGNNTIYMNLSMNEECYIRAYSSNSCTFKIKVNYTEQPCVDNSNTYQNPYILKMNEKECFSFTCPNSDYWFKFTADEEFAHVNDERGEYTVDILTDLPVTYKIYEISNGTPGNSVTFTDNDAFLTALLDKGKDYLIMVQSNSVGEFTIELGFNVKDTSNTKETAEEIGFNTLKESSIRTPNGQYWYTFIANAKNGTSNIYSDLFRANLVEMNNIYASMSPTQREAWMKLRLNGLLNTVISWITSSPEELVIGYIKDALIDMVIPTDEIEALIFGCRSWYRVEQSAISNYQAF